MPETEKIDFILMGTAVPQQRKDGRYTHCTAGYSPTFDSLIRIYPIPYGAGFKRWDLIELEVERNPKDTRIESWRIKDSKRSWSTIKKRIHKIKSLKKEEWVPLIQKLTQNTCIKELNEEKLSLAVIKPDIKNAYIGEKDDPDFKWLSRYKQLTLNGKPVPSTSKDTPYHLRIKYRCPNCQVKTFHDQQVLEWGCYMWIFKHPDQMEQVVENVHLFEDEYIKHFFIGNLAFKRSSWVIISIFRWKI